VETVNVELHRQIGVKRAKRKKFEVEGRQAKGKKAKAINPASSPVHMPFHNPRHHQSPENTRIHCLGLGAKCRCRGEEIHNHSHMRQEVSLFGWKNTEHESLHDEDYRPR
jgi:hypothetical protein